MAGIVHADGDVAPHSVALGHTIGADQHLATVRHRVPRIRHKVEQRGIKLRSVNEALRDIRAQVEIDARLRSSSDLEQRRKVCD